MVESALEFIRIAESHGFQDLCLSMKASNPKVMIDAYRLAVARMDQEDMHYPLHLGVTEAGDGEDARVKSAIGIGTLLYDGLGDTIRVSLTEDPVHEIPVARDLADKATALWARTSRPTPPSPSQTASTPSTSRSARPQSSRCASGCSIGGESTPAVVIKARRLPAHRPTTGIIRSASAAPGRSSKTQRSKDSS